MPAVAHHASLTSSRPGMVSLRSHYIACPSSRGSLEAKTGFQLNGGRSRRPYVSLFHQQPEGDRWAQLGVLASPAGHQASVVRT